MKEDTIDINLPASLPGEEGRECHMSLELYQNACLTMGELRDYMRSTGISWECLQAQIKRTLPGRSGLEHALDRLDDYSTGLGKSLHDKDSNIW